jgi:hypothetical protein
MWGPGCFLGCISLYSGFLHSKKPVLFLFSSSSLRARSTLLGITQIFDSTDSRWNFSSHSLRSGNSQRVDTEGAAVAEAEGQREVQDDVGAAH